MERRIRRLGIFMVLCFVVLFVQLNNIQIVKANSLANSSNNPRVLAVARNDARGDILSADGVVLASSVPSSGYYKYQRVYNPYTAELFSQIVGYDSIIYGQTGVEAEYNSYLQTHTRPAKSLGDLLTNRVWIDAGRREHRRPSGRSTAAIPSGGCTRSRSRRIAGASSVSATGANFARFRCATPNCTRQRNSSPATIPCLRATCETLTPSWSVSSAMARFWSSVKKRRRGCRGGDGSSLDAAVKAVSGGVPLALVPATGRAEG